MTKISSPRILLIGKGTIADRHKKAILSVLPAAEVSQMGTREVDIILNHNNGQLFQYELEGFGFSVVASPASHHAKHLLAANEARLPALVEKPLTASLAEAIELAKSLSQQDALVQIGYVLRHSEGFSAFREQLIQVGLSGIKRIKSVCHSYLPDWRPEKDYRTSVSAIPSLGGGVLRELSHEFDYLLELFGSIIVNSAVLLVRPDLDLEVETRAQISGQLTNGAQVNISLDMFDQKVERWCEVQWGDGTELRWDVLANSVTLSKNSQTVQEWSSAEDRDDWFKKQMQAFIDALEAKKTPTPSIDDGVKVMKLIDEVEACATWLT